MCCTKAIWIVVGYSYGAVGILSAILSGHNDLTAVAGEIQLKFARLCSALIVFHDCLLRNRRT